VIDYDFELRAYRERLRAGTGIAPGDHVLDIGCGAGQSTRDAARAAAPGHVLGVDVSAPMLERARRLAVAERLDNLTFEQGDAQVHPFAPGHYDVAISRFGVMFFSDPGTAFSNIARALRVSARLVLLVWQSPRRNEWAMAIDAALNGPAGSATPAMAEDAFSLADRTATARILEAAGFGGVRFTEVREPMFYGYDLDAATEFVRGFQSTRETLASMSDTDAARALQRLRGTIAAHDTGEDGVVFDSRAWLITAHRR
jgi:ubiquinone/menaquinone biosynthesis C-methylase UbiE